MKKKINSIFSSAAVLIACAVCLCGISYSWFKQGDLFSGKSAIYQKDLIISNSDVIVRNYIGSVSANSTDIVYREIEGDENLTIDDLYPGAVQFYKTVIINDSENIAAYSVHLHGVNYDELLNDYLTIHVTSPLPKEYKANEQEHEEITEGKMMIPFLLLSDRYKIDPGSSLEIYWSVVFSELAGNECRGKSVEINAIRVGN